MKRDYKDIEPRHLQALERWIRHGINPGHFLTAVLENDLKGAFAYGDLGSLQVLWAICIWLYNRAPQLCWGSSEKVKNWEPLGEEQYAAWRPEAMAGTCLQS